MKKWRKNYEQETFTYNRCGQVYFFKVNEDSVSGTEYGEAYNLKGTVEIAPTDSGGSDVLMRTTVRMRRQAISKNWDTI